MTEASCADDDLAPTPDDYVPWPAGGCTLAEARERTADRTLWREWQDLLDRRDLLRGAPRDGAEEDADDRRRLKDAIDEADKKLNAAFWSYLREGRLIAYGRRNGLGSESERISPDLWPTLTAVKWTTSSVGARREDGERFLAVTVFPVLHAPCRIDLLADVPISKAFKRFILGDPEVQALAPAAVAAGSRFERLFNHGRCHAFHAGYWPVANDTLLTDGIAHPNPEKNLWGIPAHNPDPIEAIIAVDALRDRYAALIGMLQTGELEARGLPANPGDAQEVLKSIWLHQGFYLDAQGGDLFEETDVAPDPQHRYLRCRWKALLLCRPSGADHGLTFHVKPTGPDQLRSEAIAHDPQRPDVGVAKAGKAVQRLETTAKSQRECTEWLEQMMRASPDVRTRTNAELWAEAQRKWPRTLAHRAFLSTRQKALENTGAAAWGIPGPLPRSLHGNHRGK